MQSTKRWTGRDVTRPRPAPRLGTSTQQRLKLLLLVRSCNKRKMTCSEQRYPVISSQCRTYRLSQGFKSLLHLNQDIGRSRAEDGHWRNNPKQALQAVIFLLFISDKPAQVHATVENPHHKLLVRIPNLNYSFWSYAKIIDYISLRTK